MTDENEVREASTSGGGEDETADNDASSALAAQETPQDPTPEQQAPQAQTVTSEQMHAITARLDELERIIGELKAHDAIFDEPTHEDDTDAPMSVDEAVAALFED